MGCLILFQKHPLVATATAVAAARHSPSPQPRSLRGFIIVVVFFFIVIVIVTAVTPVLPPLFCDRFDCCVCSVAVSSPLPHPVEAIPPTISAIVIIVVVVVLFDCCVHVLVPCRVVSP